MTKKEKKEFMKILKVESLDLLSKKVDARKIIMLLYSDLLNSIQVPIQIICRSEEFDINNYKIKDKGLFDFLNKTANKENIVNKNFYIIMQHQNKTILNAEKKIVEKYLKIMNIYCEEIDENCSYNWENILELTRNYIKDEKYYYKTLWVENWPYYCKTGWLDFLYNTDMNIDINCYIEPQNTQVSIKSLRKKLMQFDVCAEIDLENTSDDGSFSAEIESTQVMLDELRSNSGKLFLTSHYITVKGKTPEELNNNYIYTKNLLSGKGIITKNCFLYQQQGYFNNSNNGKDLLDKKYNFTTSTLQCFFPFLGHNICDKKGAYIAKNTLSNNLIFLDIFAREYAVILILGLMGSGKSFLSKSMIENLADCGIEITILDKSGEYAIFNGQENFIVHSKKTFEEYSQITKRFINKVNNDYDKKQSKPRLFLVDEVWSYISGNEFAADFNSMFSEIILEGRKKYLAICLMSQLIESLLSNDAGQTITKTANITFLMKMKLNEAKMVANEFDLNEQQVNFLSVAQHEGLMLVNSNCVQFKVETTKEREIKYNTNPNLDLKEA